MTEPERLTADGEGLYEKYMLHHPADIRGCLKQLVDKRCTLLLHAAGTQQAVSALLGLAGETIWIDVPRDTVLTDHLLTVERLRIESSLDRITVRFSTGTARRGTFEGHPALSVPMPQKLMHLQRREYLRREPPGQLVCHLPARTPGGETHAIRATIADIGGGGLAVLASDDRTLQLVSGDVLHGVTLDLPEQGSMTVSLRVQHATRIDQRGQKAWRAGCSFVDLSVQDQARLLRYVMQLDRIYMARLRERD